MTKYVNNIGVILVSDAKVNKTPNKVAIASGVRKGITINSTKLKIKLHESLSSATISKTRTIQKVLNIFLFGEIVAIRRRSDLNSKKVSDMT